MSWTLDAIQLAKTKLKTRRVRLSISVVISSLLFCVLMGAAFIAHNSLKSVNHFRANGFSNRYLSQSLPYDDFFSFISDKNLVKQATVMQKQDAARKKAEANRLNVPYDSSMDPQYVTDLGPIDSQATDIPKQLNIQAPQVAAIIAKSAKKKNTPAQFKTLTKKYGAIGTYESLMVDRTLIAPPYLHVIQKGKESFSDTPELQDSLNSALGGKDQFEDFASSWQLMSNSLLKPFLLKGQDLNVDKDGTLPIIAPYSQVEKIVGLRPLSATADSKTRLQRLKELREKAAGYKFSVCYRNEASNQQVQAAIQQQTEIKQGSKQKGYEQPEFIQAPPKKPCGAVITTRDVRAAEVRQLTNNQEKLEEDFGKEAPKSQLIKFRIVGLNAEIDTSANVSLISLFKDILQSSLGSGWFTPIDVAKHDKTINQLFKAYGPLSPIATRSYYAEFSTGESLKKIISDQKCDPSPSGNDPNPYSKCTKAGKIFEFNSFGSSSAAIDDFNKKFNRLFLFAALITSGVAGIVLMGTVGRIIADSRRETAVFRAIGAKRRDIVQIYLSYTLMIGLLIILASLVFGYLISVYVNYRYSANFSVDAMVAFNVQDLNQHFSMRGFYIKDFILVSGLILAAALLAASLPLLTNMRRNPIRDMRDDR